MALPTVKISDVPENKADKIRANAVIGEIKQKEVANGYTSIEVPLTYTDEKSGDERTFTARWNVREEWFSSDFNLSEADDKEKVAYQINMQKLTRGLFKGIGSDDIDFDAAQGETVGFATKPRRDDPSRLEISSFYAPKN